jgi:hypothetical protein
MNRIYRIRRSLAVLAGLAGAVLALAGAAPAFAVTLPPPGGSDAAAHPLRRKSSLQGACPAGRSP